MTNPRENPYVGPRAFTIQDKDRLFGRDRDIRALYRLLISERIVLLLSPSGAGKTSLVQAGLVPRMKEKGFDILPIVRVKQEIPADLVGKTAINRYILSSLLSLEEAELPGQEQMNVEKLADLTLKEYLDIRLGTSGQQDETTAERNFLLIFDQFEEILTVDSEDIEGKKTFFNQVGEALDDKNIWAVFVLREDHVAALDPYLRYIPTQLKNIYRLDLLDYDAASQAIRKPAQIMKVDFTDKAAEKLSNDLRRIYIQRQNGSWELDAQLGHYVEPVQLQVVCYRLWDQIGDANIIDEHHIESLGNVNEALASYYASTLAEAEYKFGVPQKEIRYWFDNRMITRNGIRSQVMWEEDASGGLSNDIILFLEKDHLIRGETRRGIKWYELTHDRLIEPIINNNKDWFDKNLSILQRQAMQWEIQEKPDHLLLRYEALDQAEKWAVSNRLTSNEENFLRESRDFRSRIQAITAEKEAEQQRLKAAELAKLNRALNKTNQRLQARNVIAFLLATLALLAGIFALNRMSFANTQALIADNQRTIAQSAEATAQIDRQIAQEQRNIAIQEQDKAEKEAQRADLEAKINLASKLSAQSLELIAVNSQRSILLALEALRAIDGTGISNAELSSLNSGLRSTLSSQHGLLLTGHKDGLRALAFSPDEHWLATAGDIVQVWDLNSPDPTAAKQILRDMPPTSAIQFSPDGRWLATATTTGDIYLWRIPLDDRPKALKILYAGANTASRKPDEQVTALAFSPIDGRWLASVNSKGTTLLWDMLSVEEEQMTRKVLLSPGVRRVNVLSFSPNGEWLATGSDDNIVRLWKISQPELLPFQKSGILGPVRALSFSPDSAFLAGSSDKDNAVHIWNVLIPENKAITLQKTKSGISTLAFNPQISTQRQLVAGLENGTTQFWNGKQDYFDGNPIDLAVQEAAITTLVFSPDAHWLATGSKDSSILLWDWQNPKNQPLRLQSLTKAITALQFSPKNHWLAIGSEDHSVRLWNLEKDTAAVEPIVVSKSEDSLSVIAPDAGSFMIVDNQKKEVTLWELSDIQPTLKQTIVLSGLKNPVSQAAYHGNTLALGISNNSIASVALMRLDDPKAVLQNLANISNLEKLLFSPDGKWLVAHSSSQLKVWDVARPEQPAINYQVKSGESFKSVVFSANNRWLISQTVQSKLLVWDLNDAKAAPRNLDEAQTGIFSYDVSPDGNWLAAGSAAVETDNGIVRIWQLTDFAAQPIRLTGHTGWINSLRFSPDSRWLASSDDKGGLILWDVQNPTSLFSKRIELQSSIGLNSIRFSPDGRWLAGGSQEGSVLLVDMQSIQISAPATATLLLGHDGPVSTLAYSPDNLWLTTSGDDGTVRLWSLADTTKASKSVIIKGYQGSPLYSARFSLNGRYILANNSNRTLELARVQLEDVKRLACEAVGRNFTRQEWDLYMPANYPYRATCPQFPLP